MVKSLPYTRFWVYPPHIHLSLCWEKVRCVLKNSLLVWDGTTVHIFSIHCCHNFDCWASRLLARLAKPTRPTFKIVAAMNLKLHNKERKSDFRYSFRPFTALHTHQTDANLYLGRLLYSIRGTISLWSCRFYKLRVVGSV